MARLPILILAIGLLLCWQPVRGQLNQSVLSDNRTAGPETNDRMPDGSSRTLAMIKEDQEKSLKDIARIKKIVTELETDLSRSEFLVSLKAIENLEEIEELAKDIQGRLKRRK